MLVQRTSIRISIQLQPICSYPYGYIYITTNLVNNKQYLGQHSKVEFDPSYLGSGRAFKRAIKKYGKENFKCEPIDWAETKEKLDQKEIWWIDFLGCVEDKSWYNVSPGGDGVGSGENHPLYGLRGENSKNGFYGKNLSKERKSKISNTLIKYFESHSPYNLGVPMGETQKENLRILSKENPNFGMKGKIHALATKKLMSQNNIMTKPEGEQFREAARIRLLNNNPMKNSECRHKRELPVYQYDLRGNLVKKYEHTSDVKEFGYNVIAVKNCVCGNQKQHEGFLWKRDLVPGD